MAELETITGDNWREFTGSPTAVLILGKTDCAKCSEWAEELTGALSGSDEFDDVRFGKLMLDTRGLIDFKKENKWIADVNSLPYNVIYSNGERLREYAGGGMARLENRLRRLKQEQADQV